MDEVLSAVIDAVTRGAPNIRSVIDATGLSRLKVERALQALEKQKLLVRDGQGFRRPGTPTPAVASARQCGSCNLCCDILEVAAVDKPVNQLCRHWAGGGCTIYEQRPQMCRSFSCAWLQGHVGDEWYPLATGMVVHFSQDAINVAVDPQFADRWQQEPYFSALSEWSLKGIRVSGGRPYATLVVVGPDKFLLLGRTVVPEPTPFGTAFLPVAQATFRYGRRIRRSTCNVSTNASPKSCASGNSLATAPYRMTTTPTRRIGPRSCAHRISPRSSATLSRPVPAARSRRTAA